jgi:hypothetical protein
MNEKTECMCLYCGIYHHLDADIITSDDLPDSTMKLVRNIFCSECSGELVIIGKENDEPV